MFFQSMRNLDFGQENDLGKMLMCHCHFFSCNSATLVANVDNGEENACVRVYGNSIFLSILL